MEKTIGLWGIVFTVTGFVVGISIFILPAELFELAGPAVLLAYAISGSMAVVTCFATAQIGTLMPTEGGDICCFVALVVSLLWIFSRMGAPCGSRLGKCFCWIRVCRLYCIFLSRA